MNIQRVAPAPIDPHLRFDPYQHKRDQLPISGRYAGHDTWESTGLSFGDYQRAHVEQRKSSFSNRRLAVPDWALKSETIGVVFISYLERRAHNLLKLDALKCLSLKERFHLADVLLKQRAQKLEKRLDKLCVSFCEVRKLEQTPERLKLLARLQRSIQQIDMQIIVERRAPEIVTAIIWKYFREGLNSVDVAAALGLHPPAVRQIVYRIMRTADALGFEHPPSLTRSRRNAGTACA